MPKDRITLGEKEALRRQERAVLVAVLLHFLASLVAAAMIELPIPGARWLAMAGLVLVLI